MPLGVLAGFFGGWLDNLTMRSMDVILAFPGLILLIWLATVLGPGVENMILALAFFSLPTYTRLTRGNTLSIREMDYVLAARSLGASGMRIVFLHILPAIIPPIIVITTLAVSGAIIAGASLSYLGLDVSPSTPEWGAMLADGRSFIRNEWWLSFFPGMVITLVVLALNVIGDAMRDALDPKVTAGR
ncbi:MAG: ABC transporter permease [Chloroflexi bacterium]|nr:ABC transporter permease [Chloroflexota bacterium]